MLLLARSHISIFFQLKMADRDRPHEARVHSNASDPKHPCVQERQLPTQQMHRRRMKAMPHSPDAALSMDCAVAQSEHASLLDRSPYMNELAVHVTCTSSSLSLPLSPWVVSPHSSHDDASNTWQ